MLVHSLKWDTILFSAMEETLSNGEKYSMRAEVGLLSRNIRIIGAEYPNMFSDSFGARVLVGVTADATRRYTGMVQLITFLLTFKCEIQNIMNDFTIKSLAISLKHFGNLMIV